MKGEKRAISFWWFLIFPIVMILWGSLAYIIPSLYPKQQDYPQTFEAINALFSGLAFGGIIIAIFFQKEDLKLQRRELELTRKELEGQKEQLKLQNETIKSQIFENTFFQLLRLQNDLINSIEHKKHLSSQMLKGRDCFSTFYVMLHERYNKQKEENPCLDELELINKIYLDLFNSIQGKVGHYFRNLYNIIKFVKKSSTMDKRFYTNLVRAQLSSYELLLLCYNCLSELGREKFKPLIEEFALLKTVPLKELLHHEHIHNYHPSAFGVDHF